MAAKLLTSAGGGITLEAASTATDKTITFPARTGNAAVDGPAFSYYKSGNQAGITNFTMTKITFTVSEFDTTGGMYSGSRFTPTVAGYYQVTAATSVLEGNLNASVLTAIFKSGVQYKQGSVAHGAGGLLPVSQVTALVYLNGSTDYLEIYHSGAYSTGSTHDVYADQVLTYFQGVLVRAA